MKYIKKTLVDAIQLTIETTFMIGDDKVQSFVGDWLIEEIGTKKQMIIPKDIATQLLMPYTESKDNEIFCNFCGKLKSEVSKLVMGPGVTICDACILECSNAIQNHVESDNL